MSKTDLNEIFQWIAGIENCSDLVQGAKYEIYGRYPCSRRQYCNIVHDLRMKIFGRILSDLNLDHCLPPSEANGMDLVATDANGDPIIAIEITNMRVSSFFDGAKYDSIQTNFQLYDCVKILVVSFACNIRNRERIDPSINILELGYQTQPCEKWIKHIEKHAKIEGMVVFTEKVYETTKEIFLNKYNELMSE